MKNTYPTLLIAATFALPMFSPFATAEMTLEERFQAAVKDAETATADEIARNLAAISPLNKNLVWKQEQNSVLVLTWTGWNGYDSEVGNDITLQREVWVTPVPYLQNFCRNHEQQGNALTLRLEQLLGLPPGNNKSRFVEMWVHPNDLFRPSADPAITDNAAELSFPIATGMTISQSHKDWINNLKNSSYGENGYPWTRLGYTYDWGNPDSEIGLSEYVVRQGATINIQAVHSQQQYCAH
ncbi:MAG: hypothetical protein OIF57_16440 [Marinobacterium sp.]|nr:hypothetical protein [Marinobacterium sp.]